MPDTAAVKSRAYSFSHFDGADTCLRQYEARYESKRLKYVESPQMKDGNRDHQAFHLRIKGKHALPDHLAQWEGFIAKLERTGGSLDAEANASFTRDCKPCVFFDDKVWWRNKLDVTLVIGANALIFDWKTGNDKYEKPLQLASNAVGLMLHNPVIESVSVANVYLKTGKLGTQHIYTRTKDMPEILKELYYREGRIDAARAAGNWPAMSGPLCAFCDDLTCSFNRKKAA